MAIYELADGNKYEINSEKELIELNKLIEEKNNTWKDKVMAFSSPFLETAIASNIALKRSFGLDATSAEADLQNLQKEAMSSKEKNPWTNVGGELTTALPLIGLASTGNAGAVTGLSALGSTAMEKFRNQNIVKDPTVDPRENEIASGVAGLTSAAGGFIPIVGKGLGTKVATSIAGNVGLGLGERATENAILSDYDKLQQNVTDPMAMTVDTLFGGIGGIASHAIQGDGNAKPLPKQIEGDDVPVNPSIDILKTNISNNEGVIARANKVLDKIDEILNNPRTSEAERKYWTEVAEIEKEKIAKAEQNINTALDALGQDGVNLAYKKKTESEVTSTTPEEEIVAPRASEAVPEALSVNEHIANKVEILNTITKKEHNAVINAIKSFGLENDDLIVNLNDPNTRSGSFQVTEDGKLVIGINSDRLKMIVDKLSENDNFKTKFINWSEDQINSFAKMWTIGHEIGHIVLLKLMQTEALSPALIKIAEDFKTWKTTNGIKEQGLISGLEKDPNYYSNFSEFFAQRVAKELLFPQYNKSVFSNVVNKLKSLYQTLANNFGLKHDAGFGLDFFIRNIIETNAESINAVGKTIWELNEQYQIEKGLKPLNYLEAYRNINEKGWNPKNSKPFINEVDFDSYPHLEEQQDVMIKTSLHGDIAPIGTNYLMNIVRKVGMRVASHGFGIQAKAKIWKDNPTIKYVSDVILYAKQKQVGWATALLMGNPNLDTFNSKLKTGWMSVARQETDVSVSKVLDKTDGNSLYAIYKVFEQGYNKHDYQETLKLYGSHLTPDQKMVFKTLARLFSRLHKLTTSVEGRLNKKNIVRRTLGWYPAQRQGKYSITLHLKNMSNIMGLQDGTLLTTNAVYSQRFFTEQEAIDWLKKWNAFEDKRGLQASKIIKEKDVGNTENITTFANALIDSTRKRLLEEGVDPSIIEKQIQETMDKFNLRGGVLGSHHKYRSNLPGVMGTELFKNSTELGDSFRKAIFNSIEEYTRGLAKMEIKHKTDAILDNIEFEKLLPNTVETARFMRDYAINEMNGFGKVSEEVLRFESVKEWIDNVYVNTYEKNPMKFLGAKKYPDAHITDRIQGELSRFFYGIVLMSRPTFWASQGLQFLWSGRTTMYGGSSIDSFTSFGKGIHQLLFHTDKDFVEAVFWASQKTNTFHPQFIHDLNSFHKAAFVKEGRWGKFLMDYAFGEKPSAMSDTFSRLVSFAWLYEYHKARGLSGRDLWRLAAKDTDENMVQYGRSYKAPIFQELGVIGDMMSPLQTFAQASLGNLIADINHFMETPAGKGKLKAALPGMYTTMMTMVMSGVIGGAFVAEYEAVRLLLNYLMENLGLDMKLPSIIDHVLSGDTTADRAISHGIPAALSMEMTGGEGIDLMSSNRWQPVLGGIMIGEKSFLEMLPLINWAAITGGNIKTLVGQATGIKPVPEAEERAAVMGIIPGYAKGLVDMAKYDSLNRENIPTKYGDSAAKETLMTNVARTLGGKTVTQATENSRIIRSKQDKKRTEEKIGKLKEMLVDSVISKDSNRTKEIANELKTKHSLTEDELITFIKNEMWKRKVPEGMRQFISKSGNSSVAQKRNYRRWQELYGDEEDESE